MRNEELVKSWAVLQAWRDNAQDGAPGMLAALFVMRNRMRDGRQGWADFGEVVTNHHLHAGYDVLTAYERALSFPHPADPELMKITQRVDEVFDGSLPDPMTAGALYYADLGRDNTPWFLKNPGKYPRVATVGATTYFGEVK